MKENKKPEIEIKEILDREIRVEIDGQMEIDSFMSRTAKLLRKGYVAFLRQHLPNVQYVKAKDIACYVFKFIEWEDFNKEDDPKIKHV